MKSVYYKGKEFQVKNGKLGINQKEVLDINEIKGLENLHELKENLLLYCSCVK